jgi:hypothetical protein
MTPMLKLTWARPAAWRSHRRFLDKRAPSDSMLSVTTRLCGLRAQLMSSAELTIWARVKGLGRQAVQQALWDHRTLIKTWAMRGTLYVLPADEVWLWHSALTTNRLYLKPALWKKHFGITMEELDQLTDTIAAALNGRQPSLDACASGRASVSGSASLVRVAGWPRNRFPSDNEPQWPK